MDLTKIGTSNWSEFGSIPNKGKASKLFKTDVQTTRKNDDIDSLLKITRSKNERLFLDAKQSYAVDSKTTKKKT